MKSKWLLLVLPLFLSACGYNSIQTMDETAAASKQQIEVQLQRRADLVPNLVETVKGYAAQEATIFTAVAEARAGLAGAVRGGDVRQMATANDQMTGALGRLLAISENYPQLKSDQNFLRLQDELAGNGEPDRGRTHRLQQCGARLQCLHPQVPGGADGEGDRGQGPRVLRSDQRGGG